MKSYDEKMRAALRAAMQREQEMLEEEVKQMGPHVFSEEHNRKIEEILQVSKKKSHRREVVRYAAATLAVLCILAGVFFVGSEELRASKMGINIVEWLEDFFVLEEGKDTREDDGVLFTEEQLGYVPEGFEKVVEEVTFPKVYYKYQNEQGTYFILQVFTRKVSSMVDNEEIKQNFDINKAGYEYQIIYKGETEEYIITWEDENGKYYMLQGTIDEKSIITIMDGITY